MISTLSDQDIEIATRVLVERVPIDEIIEALSEHGVYLGLQEQLITLSAAEAHSFCARSLVMMLGDQLLSNRAIRSGVSDGVGRSWSPGSPSLVELCQDKGLPLIFAGAKHYDHHDPVEDIQPPTRLPSLQDYQEEVLRKVLDEQSKGTGSVMVSLPTGAGKTRVATEIVRSLHGDTELYATIWVAHTEELCEQAIRCIKEVWGARPTQIPITIFRAWGTKLKSMTSSCFATTNGSQRLIVTTPMSLTNILKEPGWSTLAGSLGATRCVVVDEAHRAGAASYKSLLNAIDSLTAGEAFHIGLSATPVRETYSSKPYRGTRELSSLFRVLVEPVETFGEKTDPHVALQQRGILSTLEVRHIKTPKQRLIDVAAEIASLLTPELRGSGTLIFTNTAAEAKLLAMHLTSFGVVAESVSASTSAQERDQIVRNLKRRAIEALCNCEMLTTGFDAPNVSNVILLRNTQSPVLYKQMIGRGLRGPAHGGSSICNLFLYNLTLPFPENPNTIDFARKVWSS